MWYCLGVAWVMGQEGVSDEMGWVTNGKAHGFGGTEFKLSNVGPTGADVYRVLKNIIPVTGDNKFDIILREEAVC